MLSNRANTRVSMLMPDRLLTAIGKLNVPLYRLSRRRVMGKVGTSPVLLLTSTGRRSGQQRTAPVVYLTDAECLVVVGSNAGNHRAELWKKVNELYEGFDSYDARTARDIAVFILEPR